jgi:L-threonylcarbamoyladenylate synthase
VRTLVRVVDPVAPDPAVLAEAADLLRAGRLVVFPTETVYGLGADATNAAAASAVFAAKGRPAINPLIVHVPSGGDVLRVAGDFPESARRLVERFWPGPLTLVLPKGRAVAEAVTGGGPTVAVRVPAHPVALGLLRAAGVPVAAPSANRSSQLSPTTAAHVLAGLDGRVDLVIDAGPTTGGLESTVLDLTRTPPRLLRPGLIAPGELEAVVGVIQRPAGPATDGPALPSPGMLDRHYAPRTPLVCLPPTEAARAVASGERVGWLTATKGPAGPSVECVRLPADPAVWAARLYAELHRLDGMGLELVVVDMPPAAEEWLAVRDRLRRAAVPG